MLRAPVSEGPSETQPTGAQTIGSPRLEANGFGSMAGRSEGRHPRGSLRLPHHPEGGGERGRGKEKPCVPALRDNSEPSQKPQTSSISLARQSPQGCLGGCEASRRMGCGRQRRCPHPGFPKPLCTRGGCVFFPLGVGISSG